MRARHCALATFLLIGPWQCTALHAHAASHLCRRSYPYDGAPPLRLLRPRARWPLLAAEMPRCCDEAIHSCSAAAFRRRAVAVRMMMSPEVLERSIRPILVTVALSTAAMVPTSVGAFAPGDRPMKKLWRRGFTGFAFAVFVSSWIFSGTYAFLSVFALFAVIAQNEYYNMARRNGVNPTWKLGLLGSVLMYVAAASPSAVLRDAVFPLTGCGSIVYLLLRPGFEQSYSNVFPWFDRKTPPTTYDDVRCPSPPPLVLSHNLAGLATGRPRTAAPTKAAGRGRVSLAFGRVTRTSAPFPHPHPTPVRPSRLAPPLLGSPQVATTFFGIFLFGYMPSFWIRLRCIAPMHPSAVLSLVAAPAMRSRWPLAAIERCGADVFTHGAIVQ
eukprot:scaffold4227_cov96-Isochrysis_galbana.AAC.1